MTDTISSSTRADLVKRAADLIPLLQEKAQWAEDERRIHPQVLSSIADAGLLRMRVPIRYGGLESDMGTLVEVLTQLGRGDGSAAWTVSVWSICSWLVGLFPDDVQDEIFAKPDVRVCGLLSPTGTATPVDGGYVVSGRWAFNTGSLDSDWNELVAMGPAPGDQMQPMMALVPMAQMEIVDDWYAAGLRGTGSVSTVAREVFVPARRVLPMGAALNEMYASKLNADNPIYKGPLLLTACTSTVGTALGLAEAARENFFERLPGRKITYTSYLSQGEAPVTHLEVAEAVMKIDEAHFHAERAAGELDAKNAAGASWTPQERARIRLDVSMACLRAKEATDLFSGASGASSVYSSVPMQRIVRDLQTLNLHGILHPSTNLELYGRICCGLEPNTLYL